jgi:DNA-binding GntR family transcriptional regulator
VAPPIYQRIVQHYAAKIRSGQVRPGDWLPTQQQIAQEWECSLTPVRHALAVLESMGLVENLQGKGARVVAQPPDKG